MGFAMAIRYCRVCGGEVPDRMEQVSRSDNGGAIRYRHVRGRCSTCHFRRVQLPQIARARRRA